MRVFVAGATGAIGRPLITQLIAGGHEVFAFTRSGERAADLASRGVEAVVADVFDAEAVDMALERIRPDAVIDCLTSLPPRLNPRKLKEAYDANDRVRREGSGNLIDAAKRYGVKRYVIESVAFIYKPADTPRSESDPIWSDAPAPFDASVAVLDANEHKITEAEEFTGIVLRFGFFYGPGTYYGEGGSTIEDLKQRKYPIVGDGNGHVPLVHVSDAAAAAVLALDRGEPGIYNITEDESPRVRELLPFAAGEIGAKRPRSLPQWLVRLVVGSALASMANGLPAVSNAKARAELGFEPATGGWRKGFAHHLGDDPRVAV